MSKIFVYGSAPSRLRLINHHAPMTDRQLRADRIESMRRLVEMWDASDGWTIDGFDGLDMDAADTWCALEEATLELQWREWTKERASAEGYAIYNSPHTPAEDLLMQEYDARRRDSLNPRPAMADHDSAVPF